MLNDRTLSFRYSGIQRSKKKNNKKKNNGFVGDFIIARMLKVTK